MSDLLSWSRETSERKPMICQRRRETVITDCLLFHQPLWLSLWLEGRTGTKHTGAFWALLLGNKGLSVAKEHIFFYSTFLFYFMFNLSILHEKIAHTSHPLIHSFFWRHMRTEEEKSKHVTVVPKSKRVNYSSLGYQSSPRFAGHWLKGSCWWAEQCLKEKLWLFELVDWRQCCKVIFPPLSTKVRYKTFTMKIECQLKRMKYCAVVLQWPMERAVLCNLSMLLDWLFHY